MSDMVILLIEYNIVTSALNFLQKHQVLVNHMILDNSRAFSVQLESLVNKRKDAMAGKGKSIVWKFFDKARNGTFSQLLWEACNSLECRVCVLTHTNTWSMTRHHAPL